MKKILVIGDSITKGIIYDDVRGRYVFSDNCFVNLLKKDNKLDIENVSLMGSTVTKGMNTLDRISDEIGGYDYTCVEFGGNDCNFVWSEVSDAPDAPHDCLTPIEHFSEVYESMIEKIRALGSTPVAVSLPPISSSKFYNWIIRGLNEANIFSFIGEKEKLGRWQKSYNKAVAEIAEKMNVPLIDITAPFFKEKDIDSLFCTDGIHPNEKGHKIIYDEIQRTVIPQIA